MKNMTGKSLLEALLCLALISIFSSVTIPAIGLSLENQRRQSATIQMLGVLKFARGQAVFGRQKVSICHGSVNCERTGDWSQQLLVFSDINGNGLLDGTDTVLRAESIGHEIYWKWAGLRSTQYLQFEPDGTTLAFNGTFTLCHEGKPFKQIVINIAGRMRTQPPSSPTSCS